MYIIHFIYISCIWYINYKYIVYVYRTFHISIINISSMYHFIYQLYIYRLCISYISYINYKYIVYVYRTFHISIINISSMYMVHFIYQL